MTREDAIRIIRKMLAYTDLSVRANLNADMVDACHLAIKALEQEPQTGYWIKYDKEYSTAEKLTPVIHSIRECSECHTRIADFCGEMKYCPNCGVRMEK